MSYDYSQDVTEAKAGDNILARISQKADEAAEAAQAVADAEARLKVLKDRHSAIIERELVELMEEAAQSQLKTINGRQLKLEEVLRASIPRDRQLEAFDWLKEFGHDSIIKREVVVQFGRGEEDQADKVAADLEARTGHPVVNKPSVHTQTLQKLIRELLAEGVSVPLETFGVHIQKVVKIG